LSLLRISLSKARSLRISVILFFRKMRALIWLKEKTKIELRIFEIFKRILLSRIEISILRIIVIEFWKVVERVKKNI